MADVPASPVADYGVIKSPLSDLGKSGAKTPVAEPTKLEAFPVDTPEEANEIQVGKWSTGLFNCFDFCVPNCLMATFCPCISIAQIATRIGYKYQTVLIAFGIAIGLEYLMYGLMSATVNKTTVKSSYNYDPVTGVGMYSYDVSSSGFTFWGYISFALSVAIFVAFWQLRTKVRAHFDLPGSCVEDFFVSWCCSCCSIAQMATHVKSYKPHSCDFGPPDELPAYSSRV